VDDALKILEKEHKIAEGYPTAQVVHDLAMKHEIEIPVMGKIYEVLYEGKNPIDAMYELMTRQLKFIG
jgi:glycerol-3-phosphate dehydrogenase (NAD(P)+)